MISRLGLLLIYPALVAHELTHWVATVTAAEDTRLVFDGAQAAVLASWADGTPRWRAVVTNDTIYARDSDG